MILNSTTFDKFKIIQSDSLTDYTHMHPIMNINTPQVTNEMIRIEFGVRNQTGYAVDQTPQPLTEQKYSGNQAAGTAGLPRLPNLPGLPKAPAAKAPSAAPVGMPGLPSATPAAAPVYNLHGHLINNSTNTNGALNLSVSDGTIQFRPMKI